jgi:hypothetical protein
MPILVLGQIKNASRATTGDWFALLRYQRTERAECKLRIMSDRVFPSTDSLAS